MRMTFVMLSLRLRYPYSHDSFSRPGSGGSLPAGVNLDQTNFVFLRRLMLGVACPRGAHRMIRAGSLADDDCVSRIRIAFTERYNGVEHICFSIFFLTGIGLEQPHVEWRDRSVWL